MYKLEAIEIQTVSYCNSSCVVCPWHDMKGRTKLEYMSDTTWRKLLEELSVLKPQWIIPYLNNEPFIDNQMIDRLHQIKTLIPTAKIEISTNGMLLTPSIADRLSDLNIDKILFSMFGNDRGQTHKIMGKSINYEQVCKNILYLNQVLKERRSTTSLSVVKLTGLEDVGLNIGKAQDSSFWTDNGISIEKYGFVNRSGLIQSKQQRNIQIQPEGCDFNRHLDRTYIFHNGNVSFCCHDWLQNHIVGNINTSSLDDILHSQEYNLKRLQVAGLEYSEKDFLCRPCYHCVASQRKSINNILDIQKIYQNQKD